MSGCRPFFNFNLKKAVAINGVSYIVSFKKLYAIWYDLNNFKNVKNTYVEVLLLVKLQTEVCKFTKSNTPP